MKAIDNSNHNNGFYEFVVAAVLDWILHYRITNQLLIGILISILAALLWGAYLKVASF